MNKLYGYNEQHNKFDWLDSNEESKWLVEDVNKHWWLYKKYIIVDAEGNETIINL